MNTMYAVFYLIMVVMTGKASSYVPAFGSGGFSSGSNTGYFRGSNTFGYGIGSGNGLFNTATQRNPFYVDVGSRNSLFNTATQRNPFYVDVGSRNGLFNTATQRNQFNYKINSGNDLFGWENRDSLFHVNSGSRLVNSVPQNTGNQQFSKDDFLEAIRSKESGNDYKAQNPRSSASGAYQFIDKTWRSLGGSTAHAKDASAAEQDRIASRYAEHLLKKYGNDYYKAARAWNQGEPRTEKDPNAGRAYADDIIRRMNE
ncbi:unnamed protein product [Adineta ricciae]|uniref:Resuscitation-promoting factor core lysozyme-like domain-containing protein n=1 Tax=Adineta ricciae TaxID=249248 RepID=A0A815UFE2_ADIRI|nr:unnamed protein product [Adineta ricciae]CAF1653245.1 unnamed protein product [Adineta ricciae]